MRFSDKNWSSGRQAALSEEELTQGFTGLVEPVRLSPLYGLGLCFVALAMCLSLAMYLGALLGGFLLLYVHATANLGLLLRGPSFVAVLLYLAPLWVGSLFLLFLLKPLWSQRGGRTAAIPVEPKEEPRLVAFVDGLCDVLQAPKPAQIAVTCDVNASAGFRGGFRGLLRNEFVLTLGLPLVLGLNTRQLAGVLAHELAHCAQGFGMRMSFVLQRVNSLFLRMIARDAWDVAVEALASKRELPVRLTFRLIQAIAWIARRVMVLFYVGGSGIGSFLLRQMELDADRYQARLAGSQQFQDTMLQVHILSAASEVAKIDLFYAWQEQRLPNDLTRLIDGNLQRITGEMQRNIQEKIRCSKTAWWASHPSDAERIQNVALESWDGVFQLEAPAQQLFDHFTALSQRASLAHYKAFVDPEVCERHLENVDETLLRQTTYEKTSRAVKGFFQSDVLPMRWLELPQTVLEPPSSPEIWPLLLAEARDFLEQEAEGVQGLVARYEEAEQHLLRVHRYRVLLRAGCEVVPSALGLKGSSTVSIQREGEEAAAIQLQTETPLQKFSAVAVKRLFLALQLLHSPWAHSDGNLSEEELREEAQKLLQVFGMIQSHYAALRQMRAEIAAVQVLASYHRTKEEQSARFSAALEGALQSLQRNMRELHVRLSEMSYPFPHANSNLTLATYLVPDVPSELSISPHDWVMLSNRFLDKLFALFARVTGRLVVLAESMEASVGLFPLRKQRREDETARMVLSTFKD